jgi:uncharacterized protein (TIGR00730 family)
MTPHGDDEMRICVYCSSSAVVDEAHVAAARELGALIAARGHSLVFGGCHVGLMGDVAQAVKEGGGQVLGVVPRRIADRGLVYADADEILITETMAERKALMEEHSDAYVALPGGFGTLEETLQALTLKQLGYLQGPIVLLNTREFYSDLLAHFGRLYSERFARPEYARLYYVAATPHEAMEYIEGYRDEALPEKWI